MFSGPNSTSVVPGAKWVRAYAFPCNSDNAGTLIFDPHLEQGIDEPA
jgi:hypothetical protein